MAVDITTTMGDKDYVISDFAEPTKFSYYQAIIQKMIDSIEKREMLSYMQPQHWYNQESTIGIRLCI